MAVLNACQSAMIDGQTNDPFASVAARLLQAGIPSVVAMGYSLSLSAAKQFVPAFYAALFRNGDPAGAIRAGRRAMYAHPERPCFYGECPLQDWIIPQLYQQVSAEERILPAVGKASRTREDAFPDELRKIGDYGLIGRGREIHDLERILQRRTQAGILIHGMAGAGKTTLAKGFLQWLRDTSGLREADGADCPVFWFNFQEIHSAEAILNPLADAFLGETARTMESGQILDALTDILKTRRAYLVWDNFESASGIPGTEVVAFMSKKERGTLKTLLRNLRDGKTRVFITSRTNEDWLGEECARLETLGGLEGDELWDYCREVVRDLGLTIDRDDKNLKALLEKLDGNPLALRVILLRLGEGKKAKDLLEELDRQFTGAVGDDGTEQIQKAFGVLKAGIDPALSPVLQVIGLHERYADADWVDSILGNMAGLTDPDSPEAQSLGEHVTRCFQILENAGLCICAGEPLYRLHSALHGCLLQMYPPPEDTKRWFVQYLVYEEWQVHNSPTQLLDVFSYYETNFFHAKTLAEKLNMRKAHLQLTFGLAYYALDRSRIVLAEERYRELAENARRYGDFDMEYRAYAILAELAKNQKSSQIWMQKAADMWTGVEESAEAYFTLGQNARSQGDSSTAKKYIKRALAIWEREKNLKGASLYAILGELEREQGNLESSKEWYQKQWEVAKNLGLTEFQAIASLALGRIASKQSNFGEALKRYKEALEIFQDLQEPLNIADTFNAIGELFIDVREYKSAKEHLVQSVQIAEHIGDVQLTAANYNALGALSVKQGDFVSARDWFAKALSMLEAMGDTENAAIARRNLERVTVDEAAQHKKEEST